jgi:hypothetical protein
LNKQEKMGRESPVLSQHTDHFSQLRNIPCSGVVGGGGRYKVLNDQDVLSHQAAHGTLFIPNFPLAPQQQLGCSPQQPLANPHELSLGVVVQRRGDHRVSGVHHLQGSRTQSPCEEQKAAGQRGGAEGARGVRNRKCEAYGMKPMHKGKKATCAGQRGGAEGAREHPFGRVPRCTFPVALYRNITNLYTLRVASNWDPMPYTGTRTRRMRTHVQDAFCITYSAASVTHVHAEPMTKHWDLPACPAERCRPQPGLGSAPGARTAGRCVHYPQCRAGQETPATRKGGVGDGG